MQLKPYLYLLLLLVSVKTFAQKQVALIGGKTLYDSIYKAAYRHMDELEQLNNQGTLFIQIDLQHGLIKNIKFSATYPMQLLRLLEHTIKNSNLKLAKKRSPISIIIPVNYNYRASVPTKMSELLKQIPTVDVNNLPAPDSENDHNHFLGTKANKEEVVGITCIFLPWITLNGKIS